MAFTSVGCISASLVFATQLWPAGVKTLGPVDLPDKFRYGSVLVDISQLTDLSSTIIVQLELSMDGVAFTSIGGFGLNLTQSGYTITAGQLFDGAGEPVRIFGWPVKFPQAGLITRKIRGTASLSTPAVVGMTLVIW